MALQINSCLGILCFKKHERKVKLNLILSYLYFERNLLYVSTPY